jgi:hypothetical protein
MDPAHIGESDEPASISADIVWRPPKSCATFDRDHETVDSIMVPAREEARSGRGTFRERLQRVLNTTKTPRPGVPARGTQILQEAMQEVEEQDGGRIQQEEKEKQKEENYPEEKNHSDDVPAGNSDGTAGLRPEPLQDEARLYEAGADVLDISSESDNRSKGQFFSSVPSSLASESNPVKMTGTKMSRRTSATSSCTMHSGKLQLTKHASCYDLYGSDQAARTVRGVIARRASSAKWASGRCSSSGRALQNALNNDKDVELSQARQLLHIGNNEPTSTLHNSNHASPASTFITRAVSMSTRVRKLGVILDYPLRAIVDQYTVAIQDDDDKPESWPQPDRRDSLLLAISRQASSLALLSNRNSRKPSDGNISAVTLPSHTSEATLRTARVGAAIKYMGSHLAKVRLFLCCKHAETSFASILSHITANIHTCTLAYIHAHMRACTRTDTHAHIVSHIQYSKCVHTGTVPNEKVTHRRTDAQTHTRIDAIIFFSFSSTHSRPYLSDYDLTI